MPRAAAKHIGLIDGDVLAVHVSDRRVTLDFGGARLDMTPQAWRKLAEFVEAANEPSSPTETEAVIKRRHHNVSVDDLVSVGYLAEGERLLHLNDPNVAAVVTDEGIEFDGIVYRAPSTAATVAAGGAARNGWIDWTKDGVPLADLRSRYLDTLGDRPLR